MLPAIGFIVATYTIFRFIEKMRSGSGPLRFLGALAIVITLFLCYSLWQASSSMPSLPNYH
jgi:hypothetical protein